MYLLFILLTRGLALQLVYAGKYSDTAWLLPYLALMPVIAGLSSGWLLALRILEKTSLVFLADLVGAILTLTLGVFLVTKLGLAGAVIGMVLSSSSRIVILPFLWAKANKTQRGIEPHTAHFL